MSITTTTTNNGPLVSFIERAAKDPEFDIAKFGELLRMQREIERDQARRAFDAAMSDAQAQMMPVVRDAKNSHLNNKYARLETIDNAIRPVYTDHGFSVRYGSAQCPTEGSIRIVCTVAHSGGFYEEHYLDAPLGNAGAMGGRTATTPVQAIGSAITYLRRYLLGMCFNVVLADEDDDDGEGTRRAAATRTPPNPRVSDTTVYEPPRRTIGDLLDAMELALGDAQSPGEADAILRGETMRKLDEHAKGAARERLDAIKAKSAERFPAPAQPMTEDDDAWPGGDLEIVGGDKLAAG